VSHLSKVADFNLPHLHFAEIFSVNELESMGICVALFA